MRALSVRQPWALEINDGIKNLEFRTWHTNHRGPLLICASSADSGLWVDVEIDGETQPLPLPTGCMMCVVNLVNIREMTREDAKEYGIPYDPVMLAWELEGGYEVIPEPVKGRLNVFEVDDDLIEPMPEGDGWFDYDYPNRNKKQPKEWAA
ncbi:MAG TPA: ASCH domain-containing protein [Accumulibacter sp.]|nr:ASCH domain-containing protein [Accumulibacter sp.]